VAMVSASHTGRFLADVLGTSHDRGVA